MQKRIVASIVAVLFAAGTAPAGLHYTSTTRTQATGKERPAMSMEAWIEGANAKFAFTEGNPKAPKGGYMLTKDGGKTMFMVNPNDKTYLKWDMAAMMGGAMQMMKGMMQMKVSDPKVEKILDEKGPDILGYATRHIKFKTTYSMEMSMMGMRNANSVVTEEEMWVTDKIGDAAVQAFREFAAGMKLPDEELEKLVRAQKDKVKGFPLKMISSNSTTGNDGRAQTSVTTMEVTKIENQTVPASTFEIPADYKETTLPSPDESAGAGGANKKMPGLDQILGGKGKIKVPVEE